MSVTKGSPFSGAAPSCAAAYLWPAVGRELDRLALADKRVFDLGCGNGSTAQLLLGRGFAVTGVDPSPSGIEQARKAFPQARFEIGTTDDDLAGRFGRFPLVVSLEVIEHCFSVHSYARTCFELLEPGGTLVCSTPYHGYLKNLALSLADGWDRHHASLTDGGHIKFFSPRSLERLLRDHGFSDIRIVRIGRIPPLAKSMIVIARRSV